MGTGAPARPSRLPLSRSPPAPPSRSGIKGSRPAQPSCSPAAMIRCAAPARSRLRWSAARSRPFDVQALLPECRQAGPRSATRSRPPRAPSRYSVAPGSAGWRPRRSELHFASSTGRVPGPDRGPKCCRPHAVAAPRPAMPRAPGRWSRCSSSSCSLAMVVKRRADLCGEVEHGAGNLELGLFESGRRPRASGAGGRTYPESS